MSEHIIITERHLKENMNETENEDYIKLKLAIKTIQKIIKKIQKCKIAFYTSSLRAEATCEFY